MTDSLKAKEREAAIDYPDTVALIEVDDQESYETGVDVVKNIKALQSRVEDVLGDIKKSTYATYKKASDHYNDHMNPLKAAETAMKLKCTTFTKKVAADERAKALEYEKRLEDERNKIEADKKKADDAEKKAVKNGNPAPVLAPIITAPVAPPAKKGVAKVSGVSNKSVWKAEIEDYEAFLRYLVDTGNLNKNVIFMEAVKKGFTSWLNGHAKQNQDSSPIAGIKFVEDIQMAVR